MNPSAANTTIGQNANTRLIRKDLQGIQLQHCPAHSGFLLPAHLYSPLHRLRLWPPRKHRVRRVRAQSERAGGSRRLHAQFRGQRPSIPRLVRTKVPPRVGAWAGLVRASLLRWSLKEARSARPPPRRSLRRSRRRPAGVLPPLRAFAPTASRPRPYRKRLPAGRPVRPPAAILVGAQPSYASDRERRRCVLAGMSRSGDMQSGFRAASAAQHLRR